MAAHPMDTGRGRTVSKEWREASNKYGLGARERKAGFHNELWVGTLNLFASFVLAARCVVTPDSLLGAAIAVASTAVYWHLHFALGTRMDWNLVGLVVVFPISQAIGMGFKRREHALKELSIFLGNMRSVWGAMYTWQIKLADGRCFAPCLDDDEQCFLLGCQSTAKGLLAKEQCSGLKLIGIFSF